MMRYIRSLERKDIGLDTSMIPLGSCTMKLNAASEMLPITWPEFGKLHPFAPVEQTEGYQQVFKELEAMLCEITVFAAVSLQPNSGAQGEFAGLMVIRQYHRERGDTHIVQRADHVVARREPCARDAVCDHLGVAQDRRAVCKRPPRRVDEACAERDMASHFDTPASMNHAHDNVGFVG